jgi:hypothetical protein
MQNDPEQKELSLRARTKRGRGNPEGCEVAKGDRGNLTGIASALVVPRNDTLCYFDI